MCTQLEDLAPRFEQLLSVRVSLVRLYGFNPLIQTVRRYTQSGRNFGNFVPTLDDLPDRFVFELRRKTLLAHSRLLGSNYGPGVSVVPWEVHIEIAIP